MAEENSYVPAWQQFKHDSETTEPIKLEVKGTIPDWVSGSLYRNGCGVFEFGESKLKHLFDGMAVLHRFSIKNGEVMFQNKVLDSDTWNKCYKANRLVTDQFGTHSYPDPCKTIFSRIFSFFTKEQGNTDNTCVNIVETGDELWALTETTKINRVDPTTLCRMERIDEDKYLAVHMSTAHPHIDKDGTLYNLATNFNPKSAYNIIKIPPKSNGNMDFDNAELVVSLPSRWKFSIGYNHSFGMSDNHFIILEQPFVFSLLKLMLRKFTICECFVPYPKEKALFHVTRKDGTRVDIKYVVDPMFVFHYCNCFEKDGQLVIDVAFYKDVDIVNKLYLDNIKGNRLEIVDSYPTFGRFVLPLDIQKAEVNTHLITLDTEATAIMQQDGSVYCTPDLIVDGGVIMELPQINYKRYNGKDYRYVYASTMFTLKQEIVKLDLKTRTVKTWSEVHGEGKTPGEPVFLPKPGATKEDEGVLLVPVMANKLGSSSYLLVLDAESMSEIARAILPADVIMTITFHGTFRNNAN